MATKLGIFNATLDELGHRPVTDTGEPVEAARVLSRRYDRVVADCLSEASWNFAMETIEATSDTGVTPEFGYGEVFAKPSDWVRTISVSMDEYFSYPLLQYYDDANFWSADVSPLYIRYVSNDTGLGMDMTRWTPAFTRYVELELAHRAWRINNDKSLREEIGQMRDRARKAAKNQDAMNEAATKFPPPSSWTRSRWGDGGGNDRGGRGSLTG